MSSENTKTVLLRAPSLSLSGYGVYARQIARWLFDKADNSPRDNKIEVHTQLLNWGRTPWITDTNAQDGLIGRCLQASNYPKEKYDVTIQMQLPNEWYPELGKFNVGVTAGVEADGCNPQWIDAVNKMDLVIVLSEFTKKAFTNTGLTKTPIVVVPCSFPDIFLQDEVSEENKINLDLETKFNFLIFGQLTGGNVEDDRKNLPFTIKWLMEEFQNDKDVGVVLKTNAGRFSKLDRHNCTNLITNIMKQINKAAFPRFYLLHGEMSEHELASLYTQPSIKALVTATHGEGFGLPILEAAACGLPVIATDRTAHTEFLGLGQYIKLESNLVKIPDSRVDGQIWMKDTKWAHVSEQEFKKKVRKFYESSATPRVWAKDLKRKMHEKYCFESISKQYTNVFQGIL